MKPEHTEKLAKVMAAAGAAARRKSEDLIRAGRVAVNGEVVTNVATRVDPAADRITLDGKRLQPARSEAFLLNKPAGYVTTLSDPQGRPTVMDLVPRTPGLHPAGRLDLGTEGLLVLTNDGELTALLTHPRHEVERVYRARVAERPSAEALEHLRRGVVLDAEPTQPARVHVVSETRGGAILEIAIHEGRNRQVRRVLEAVGHPVLALKRIRHGALALGRLRSGEWRRLTQEEIRKLKAGSRRQGGGRRT
jgi:pseudouridine synthase